MLDKISTEAADQARTWVASFDDAFSRRDARLLADLFQNDAHWRNLGGLSWPISTFGGRYAIARELLARADAFEARAFEVDATRFKPGDNVIAGREVVEAAIHFETAHGPGEGVVRLLRGPVGAGPLKAWTLSTGLDMEGICRARTPDATPESHARDFSEPTWRERREASLAYADREPDVLIVGGGHAGVTSAAELKRLGYDALIIDRLPRVGDNWRLRYEGLKLHNKWPVNHFRYLPFPVTMPDYMPKDKIANWIEFYVDALDLNFWTGAGLDSAAYDERTGRWAANVMRTDRSQRTLRPRHIVMATSVSGTPNIPAIPTIDKFAGPILHSSEFVDGAQWSGKSVVVFGSGTSGHDICQELHAFGATATMVQRSPTLVVNVEPSAQLYDSIYLGDGPPLEIRDLLNSSIPYPVARQVHQAITRKVKEIDAPLLDRLHAVGFRLDFGVDETGWPLKFRTRGGGYYFNVGCSDLIADGAVGLVQASDIDSFVDDGIRLADGSVLTADLVVLATGFKGHDHMVRSLFGEQVADRVGPIWGLHPEYHELQNMWTKTGQPGLWFTGGAFSMSRIYSRNIALQIDAIETGRLEK